MSVKSSPSTAGVAARCKVMKDILPVGTEKGCEDEAGVGAKLKVIKVLPTSTAPSVKPYSSSAISRASCFWFCYIDHLLVYFLKGLYTYICVWDESCIGAMHLFLI
jgi:hypothetical protein